MTNHTESVIPARPLLSALARPAPLAAAIAMMMSAGHVPAAHARQPTVSRHTKRHSAPTARRAADPLGASIVAFARAHEGQVVSTGECAALADAALRQAGARTADSFGDIGPDTDYVWGRPVSVAQARPGDILQFHDYNITTTVETTYQYPGGQPETTQNWMVSQRPHHTAIVERNDGGSLLILEQNAPQSGGAVREVSLPLESGTTSRVSTDGVPATETTTVQVDGDVRVYRPIRALNSHAVTS